MKELISAFIHKFKTHLGRRFLLFNAILLILVKVIIPLGGVDFSDIQGQITATVDSREIITETNNVRQLNGLQSLSPNLLLDNAANDKLQDMLKNNYFDHVSPSGVTPWYWITSAGYNYSIAGENLAVGFVSAKDTVSAWMDSDSHRANLLHPKYTEIGVASAPANVGGVEGILVVQMFGVSSRTTVAVTVPTPKPVITAVVTPVVTPLITPVKTGIPSVAPTAVPSLSATPLPTASSAVAALETSRPTLAPTKAPVAEFTKISTDASVPAVRQPTMHSNYLAGLKTKLNISYVLYLSLVLLFSVFLYIAHKESRRSFIFGMAAHVFLLILAVSIPAINISTVRIVF